MEKRKILFGAYDTAAAGWTLTGWKLSAPVQKTKYLDKMGGDGSYDLSTALTEGIMRYADRQLTASFECSEGDRAAREAIIRQMVNQLDGARLDIVLPDDASHYITGRVSVQRVYSDLAHAAVTVSVVCEPWKYSDTETAITLTATTAEKTATLVNNGRRAVVPLLTVTGSSASVRLSYDTASASFGAGEHKWPDLLLTPGSHAVKYSGSGSIKITYREAVLE